MAVTELHDYGAHAEAAIAALHAALDDVEVLGLVALDIERLEHTTVELLRAGERLRAQQSRAVVECGQAGLAVQRGSVGSTAAYLASHTHGPTAPIAPLRTLGTWLVDLPELATAWAAGEITEEHLHELRRTDNARIHLELISSQQLHIQAAQNLQFTDWLHHLAYWLMHVDPDGSLEHDRKVRYGLRVRTDRRGDVHFSGIADPLTGEALLTMLDHEANKIRRAEDSEQSEDGSPGKRRTIGELNMEAFLRLATRGFERADGSYPVPLVNIVMSMKVAEDLVSRMLDGDDHDPFELPLAHADIDKRCETVRGTPIDPRRAWPALVTGRLRRQVSKAKSRTVNLGHDVRLFTAVQKQALLVESRGKCTTRGCDNPFAWLEADHKHPHGKGGCSDLGEGQIKCRPCNLRKGDRLVEE